MDGRRRIIQSNLAGMRHFPHHIGGMHKDFGWNAPFREAGSPEFSTFHQRTGHPGLQRSLQNRQPDTTSNDHHVKVLHIPVPAFYSICYRVINKGVCLFARHKQHNRFTLAYYPIDGA
jgi:hypothetical protein